MNKFLLLGFSALLFYAVAEGLMCKVCRYKIGSLCMFANDPCQAEQGQYCETTEVYKGNWFLFSKYGCGKYAELCNKTEDREDAFRTSYRRKCCNSNLCNG